MMSFKIPCGGFKLDEKSFSLDVNGVLSVSGGSGGGAQPDWNQNDSTAADYIKNRPFYTGDPVETVFVEESTVSFSGSGGMYSAQIQSNFEATAGETYKVSWDGTVYECICVDDGSILSIGNISIAGTGSDTGEPFLMGINNGSGIEIYTKDTSASHTISISGFVTEVVKIDEKYLPTIPAPIYIIKENSVFSSSITFEEAWKLPPNILASRLNLTLDASAAESGMGMACREVCKTKTGNLGKNIVATFSALSASSNNTYTTINYAIVWTKNRITQLTPKEGA